MPLMQTAISSMNVAFNDRNIRKIDASVFAPGAKRSLTGAFEGVPGLRLNRATVDYVNTWPSALRAAVQAVIHENLTRAATVPITFAWKPGYDFAVEIYDVHDTATSRGGITIILSSRYPADAHPLTIDK
jgi:hypothetical protein